MLSGYAETNSRRSFSFRFLLPFDCHLTCKPDNRRPPPVAKKPARAGVILKSLLLARRARVHVDFHALGDVVPHVIIQSLRGSWISSLPRAIFGAKRSFAKSAYVSQVYQATRSVHVVRLDGSLKCAEWINTQCRRANDALTVSEMSR
jgi:hypothetical protein